MKTIITLFIVLFILAGCSSDELEAQSVYSGFINNCKPKTINTSLHNADNKKILTITCNNNVN